MLTIAKLKALGDTVKLVRIIERAGLSRVGMQQRLIRGAPELTPDEARALSDAIRSARSEMTVAIR